MSTSTYYLKRRIADDIAANEKTEPCFECADDIGSSIIFKYDKMIDLIQSKKAEFILTLNGIDYRLKPKKNKQGHIKLTTSRKTFLESVLSKLYMPKALFQH